MSGFISILTFICCYVLNINNIIIYSFVNISIIIRTLMSRYMSFNNSLSTYNFNLRDILSFIMSLKADYFTLFSFCGTFCPARCPAKPLFIFTKFIFRVFSCSCNFQNTCFFKFNQLPLCSFNIQTKVFCKLASGNRPLGLNK